MFVHVSAVEHAGMNGLKEAQRVHYEVQINPKNRKTSAENLHPA